MRFIVLTFILLLAGICVGADNLVVTDDYIVMKDAGYFTQPVRDGRVLFPDSLVFARDAEEIHIPEVTSIGRLPNYFTNLKKIVFDDIDYVPSALVDGNATIEEIEFRGLVGHFDCYLAGNCPRLRKIVFRGPVSSTGSLGFVFNCPQLDSVIFESAVAQFGLGVFDNSPRLKGYENRGAFLWTDKLSAGHTADVESLRGNRRLLADMERLADWQAEVLVAKENKWMRSSAYEDAKVLVGVLEQLGSEKSHELRRAMEYAWNLGDEVKTYLDILKESPAYRAEEGGKPSFAYAEPNDSLLSLARQRFELDRVAGSGDDISRIKNLLYWVHDNIRHDGSNGLAPGARSLANTYDSARRDSCGYNCRALAICLTEALLAEGIPARYITCESKKWDSDGDCHVICVAWSESLGKWIWVDPTFAAYVTDENGLLLHPGEVRYRLQKDLPLVVNADANWNNESPTEKEYYLDEYMAKNLYVMSCNMLNQAEPEGPTSHPTGQYAALVPQGSNYTNAHVITTDEEWFWQAPEKLR